MLDWRLGIGLDSLMGVLDVVSGSYDFPKRKFVCQVKSPLPPVKELQ